LDLWPSVPTVAENPCTGEAASMKAKYSKLFVKQSKNEIRFPIEIDRLDLSDLSFFLMSFKTASNMHEYALSICCEDMMDRAG
jgi:hypothetical protein